MRKLILAISISTFATLAHADQLQVPVSQQGSNALQTPQQGSSQQLVLSQYGEPLKRHASVGRPPITRWDYQDFSVYFEHSTVINSVKHHSPQTAKTGESL